MNLNNPKHSQSNNIQKKAKLKSFESHLDVQYGKRGTEAREQYEEEYKKFLSDEGLDKN